MAKKVSNQKDSKKKSLDGAKGGKHGMMHRQFTGQQKAGQSSQEHSKEGGGVAKGGKTHMFGKQTVKALKPA